MLPINNGEKIDKKIEKSRTETTNTEQILSLFRLVFFWRWQNANGKESCVHIFLLWKWKQRKRKIPKYKLFSVKYMRKQKNQPAIDR
jgi:hypothetical protein